MKIFHPKVFPFLLATFLFSSPAPAQERPRTVTPAQAADRANHFYSPGVDAGDYVYISGQGPRRPDGSSPSSFAEQVRQALDNVKAVVEAAGLTTEHVVYTHIYLQGMSHYDEMNRGFAAYFGKSSARARRVRSCTPAGTTHTDQCGGGT